MVYYGSQLKGTHPQTVLRTAGKSRCQESEDADDHIASKYKKQQLRKSCPEFLLFIQPKILAHGMVPLPLRLDLSQVSLIYIAPYKHTQRLVYSVSLDHVKLIINITIKPHLTPITYAILHTLNNLTQGSLETKPTDIHRIDYLEYHLCLRE